MGTCLLQKIYKTAACTQPLVYTKIQEPTQDNYKLFFVYIQLKIYETDAMDKIHMFCKIILYAL